MHFTIKSIGFDLEVCTPCGIRNCVARDTRLVQLKLNQVMRHVNEWIMGHGLELALQKTKRLLLTRQPIDIVVPMTVEAERVLTRSEVKYLGVILDTKLNFWPHRNATSKAAGTTRP